MKPCLILSLCLLSLNASAYDRAAVGRLLQEQSYTALLALAKATPASEQDNYLLNAAGYAAFQSTLTEQASGYYRQSLVLDSANIQALLYLGLISRQEHSCTAAIPYFLRLTTLRPDNGRYYKLAADCYAELKKPDSAFALLAAAAHTPGADPGILVAYSDALIDRKDYARADTVIGAGLAAFPESTPLIGAAIKSAYFQKKYADVFPLAGQLLGTRTIAYSPFLYTMLAALQQKEYARCISYAELLLGAGYENEQVLYYTAKAYAGMQQYEESNKLLRQCIQKGISEHIEAYYTDLAGNMLAQKNYPTAQACYDTARYLTGNPLLSYRKAIAYDAAGQDTKATQAFQLFLKNPGSADTALVRYARQRVK